jgi:hypothetical protein
MMHCVVRPTNRASVFLSANALLLGAGEILLGQYVQELARIPISTRLLLSGSAGVNLLLVALSMANGARALVSLKTSRQLFGDDIPERLFFHHPDTVRAARAFQDFRKLFVNQTRPEALDYAIGELWTVIKQHNYRYQKLRRSVRMLLSATALLLVNCIWLRAEHQLLSWLARW